MKDLEYYLNKKNTISCSPTEKNVCLKKSNFLSEFSTLKEKEIARENLGITEDFFTGTHTIDEVLGSKTFNKMLEDRLLEWITAALNYFRELVASHEAAILNDYDKKYDLLLVAYNQIIGVYNDNYSRLEQDFLNLQERFNELQGYFESYVKTSTGGIVIADRFGNNEDYTISQKVITDAINHLSTRLSDYVGEPDSQLMVVITPDYCISENGCTVNIKVTSSSGIFDNLKVYAGEEEIINEDSIANLITTYQLTDTVTIRVEATILGRLYTEEKTIVMYYPFFIGSGQVWQDAITTDNQIPDDGNLEGNYYITVHNDGDKMFIVIPKSKEGDVGVHNEINVPLIQMNGYNIPLESFLVEDDKYVVYSSLNTYRAGTYPISIKNNQ